MGCRKIKVCCDSPFFIKCVVKPLALAMGSIKKGEIMEEKAIVQIRQAIQMRRKIQRWDKYVQSARWSVKRNQRQYKKLADILKRKLR